MMVKYLIITAIIDKCEQDYKQLTDYCDMPRLESIQSQS